MSVPRYWRELARRSRFETVKCSNCGHVLYPPRAKCNACGSDSLVPYKLPEKGRLLTFSIVRSPPLRFEKMSPFVIGIVELEDGTKVTAQLTDLDPQEAEIGMHLETVFRKISEDGPSGIIHYALKFRPTLK